MTLCQEAVGWAARKINYVRDVSPGAAIAVGFERIRAGSTGAGWRQDRGIEGHSETLDGSEQRRGTRAELMVAEVL